MKYIIGSTLIFLTYRSRLLDPLSKATLYMLVAGIVYYLP